MQFTKVVASVAVLLNLVACSSSNKRENPDYETKSVGNIPISVLAFRNKVAKTDNNSSCKGWWCFDSDLGSAFQDLTINELSKYKPLFKTRSMN